MQNWKNGLLLVLASLFISGCANFNNPGAEYILNVDTEFEISMREKLGGDAGSIEFTITSLDPQQCQETLLDLESRTTLNSLSIKIADIIIPIECGSKGSYPEGSTLFNVAERTYELEIDIQDIVQHKGELTVNPDSYKLSLSGEKGLILSTDLIEKIPDNFVWGYYQSSITSELNKLLYFFEENGLLIKPLSSMKQGHYSYFDVDAQGNIIIEDIPSSGHVQSFAFSDVSLAELQAKVGEFKKENPNLNINFFGSDGSEF